MMISIIMIIKPLIFFRIIWKIIEANKHVILSEIIPVNIVDKEFVKHNLIDGTYQRKPATKAKNVQIHLMINWK